MDKFTRLGTMTVKGKFPVSYDGLFLGWFEKTMKFDIVNGGYYRKEKLYKTHDPAIIIQLFEIQNAKCISTYTVDGMKFTSTYEGSSI